LGRKPTDRHGREKSAAQPEVNFVSVVHELPKIVKLYKIEDWVRTEKNTSIRSHFRYHCLQFTKWLELGRKEWTPFEH
jgi:hypothetical protein